MTAATPHKELGCWIGTIRGSKQKQLEEEFTVNQLVTGRDTFKEQSSSEVKMDRVHQSAENCRFRIMFLTVNMSSRTVMMELIHSSACHPHMQDKAPLCREEARCGVGLHQCLWTAFPDMQLGHLERLHQCVKVHTGFRAVEVFHPRVSGKQTASTPASWLIVEESVCGAGLPAAQTVHQLRTSSVSWKQSQDWQERDTSPLPNVQQPLSSAHTCLQTVVKRRQEAAQWWTWPCPPLLLPAHS